MFTLSWSTSQLAKLILLVLICILGFSVRLFSVVRYESVIHEFDPYFNYRSTVYLIEEGFNNFINWFDDKTWYPLGRVTGQTLFPGIMLTAGFFYKVLYFFNFTVSIRNLCVLIGPIFSAFTSIAVYMLTTEVWDDKAALFAAAFIAIAPGYISRSVAGSFDNEAIAIFALIFTLWLWLRSLRKGTLRSALLCALAYFYMVAAWGGYVFITNLIPLHVLGLIFLGKYSSRLYVAYSTFYVIGTLFSFNVPFVGFAPALTSEHMAGLCVFFLVQVVALTQHIRERMDKKEFNKLVRFVMFSTGAILFFVLCVLVYFGKISPLTGRFYSLFDPTYAKSHIPIIASVSEHQPPTWGTLIFDLHFLIPLTLIGCIMCVRRASEGTLFALCYAIPCLYFTGVMVRLILMLTPIACVLSGIAVSSVVSRIVRYMRREKVFTFQYEIGIFSLLCILFFLVIFVLHSNYASSYAYSSPSIVLSFPSKNEGNVILDDFREAYRWISHNTKKDAKIMSWWDYGYQLSQMANRITIVDNNTWNTTHIAHVGKAFGATEEIAYEMIKQLDVDYVLVLFGGFSGYSGDDINKFIWILRIAGLNENDYYNANGEYRIDERGSPTLLNSLMYKLSYYRYNENQGKMGKGYDYVRQSYVSERNIHLQFFEEAYTSISWLVRVYKVLKTDNRVWE